MYHSKRVNKDLMKYSKGNQRVSGYEGRYKGVLRDLRQNTI